MPASSEAARVDPTLAHFGELFGRLGIRWCVAGAVAANAYRAPRDTTDLDLVVKVEAARYSAAASALSTAGWRTIRVSPIGDYPDVVRLEHDTYFPTDLLLVKTEYQAVALDRSRPLAAASIRVHVLSAEDVIIHKLIAHRYRDRDDIIGILHAGVPIDRGYVERWAAEWQVLDRWEKLSDEAREL